MSRNNVPFATAGVIALVFVLAGPAGASETLENGKAKAVRVRCARGETIAAALRRNLPELDIVVSGTCHEDVVVKRDLVTLRGADAEAALEGSITVDGASNVTIADLQIRNGESQCLYIRHNAGAVARNLTIEDCGLRGILLEGSVATIRDVTIRRVGTVGILNRTSRVELIGNILVSTAAVAGISATDSAVIYINPDPPDVAEITVEDSLLGFVSQLSSEVTFAEGTLIARNTTLAGVLVASQGVFVHGTVTLDSSGNAGYGLWVDELSSFSPFVGFGAVVNLSNNGFDGAFVERGGALELTSATTIADNVGRGLAVEGGSLRLGGSTINTGNAGGDVHLLFGARAEFGSGNTLGSISCDSTAIVRGSASCPASPAPATSGIDERRAALRAQMREALARQ